MKQPCSLWASVPPQQPQQHPLPADPQQWEDTSPVPRPLSIPHRRSELHRCRLAPGLARLLMREMVLCLIYPPGLLECPLHCHQEYPGKITHTLPECEALDWWIGAAGDGVVLACGALGISGAWLYDDISMHVSPPPLQNLFPISLSAAEDPRLLPTDPLSYDLQSPPCLTRRTHTYTFLFTLL